MLILADEYPDAPTRVTPNVFEKAAAKKLRLYVEYPSMYRAGMGLLLSLIAERSFAFTTGFWILDRRLRDRLRFELGIAYHIDAEFQPLTANESHAWVGADTDLVDESQWLDETLAIVDAFAADGPTEEELEVERSRRRLEDSHPGSVTSWLSWAATEHLLAKPYITREDALRTADELTVLCPSANVPEGVRREGGFRALVVQGPLDFGMTGVISSLSGPLAYAGIPIFVLSTFDTDYLLVREERLEAASRVLREAGHEVFTPGLGREVT